MGRLWMVGLLLATTGCLPLREATRTMNSSVLTSAYMDTPTAPEAVDVFIAGDEVPVTCERVALLRAAGFATVVDRLREEAGRLGANAIDLRDFRQGERLRETPSDNAWNVVALHCPAPNAGT